MKKILLSIALMLCAVGSYALNQGDYVYTYTQKFKVTGTANMLANGGFTVVDPTAADFGWTNDAAGPIDGAAWSLGIGEGPEGVNTINAAGGAGFMMQSVPVETGKCYIVSVDIRLPEAGCLSLAGANPNATFDVYAVKDLAQAKDAEGNLIAQLNDREGAVDEAWHTYTYALVNNTGDAVDGNIVIRFDQLLAGAQIANVEVREAAMVFNDKAAQAEFDEIDKIIATGWFTEGFDDFNEMYEYTKQAIVENGDDLATAQSAMDDLMQLKNEWLDQNSSDYLGNIDKGSFEQWGSFNPKGDVNANNGDWVVDQCKDTTGDWRWGKRPKDFADANSEEAKGSVKYDWPGNMGTSIGWTSATIVKEGAQAGKYMFWVSAKATPYIATGGGYLSDFSKPCLDGSKVFVMGDSIDCGVLDMRNYKRYIAFGEVPEGEALHAGFYFAGFQKGGCMRLFRAGLRYVGMTPEQVAHLELIKNIKAQQDAFRGYIDIYNELQASDKYVWGKQALADTLAVYKPLYEATLVYVNEAGEDMGIDIPDNLLDDLKGYVSALTKTRSAFFSLNRPYTDLTDYTAQAEAILNDEINAAAGASERTALANGIAEAKALLEAAKTTENGEELTAKYAELQQLVDAFKMSCASYSNPASLAIINPNFQQNSGQKSEKCDGWELEINTGNSAGKNWQFGKDDKMESGYSIFYNRGYSAQDKAMKVLQRFTISKAGVYRFRCHAYAVNGKESNMNAMIDPVDSIRKSGIRLFFGTEAAPDSLDCTTDQTDYTKDQIHTGPVEEFFIRYDKTTESAEEIVFGMDANHNGEPMGVYASMFGMSDCKLYYCGPVDNYETAINTTEIKGGRKALDGAIYNIAGQRISTPTKGLYIQNGRKFVK